VTARRGASGLAGILPIDKPAGMTSHDVVAVVRRATGEGRVGHAGTLDPMATGLLVVLVGPATRLAPYLTAQRKTYEARVVFGMQTDTDDAEGQTTETSPVPAEVLDPAYARRVLGEWVGTREQMPPAYSAVKLAGRKAYEIARAGGDPELSPRTVELHAAELLRTDAGPPPAWHVSLTVSKGFYVRSFARDLGRALGTVAHLGELRRTGSGRLTLADAHELAQVTAATPAEIASLFADPIAALGLPGTNVDEHTAAAVANGAAIPLSAIPPELAEEASLAIASCGTLLGIYEPAEDGTSYRAAVVIPGGVRGGDA